MLPHQLTAITGRVPDGVTESLDVVSGVDACLVGGLARSTPEHIAALGALAQAVAASPLAQRTSDAVEKLTAGSVGDDGLAVIAGARAALQGAVHDALLEQVDLGLGRNRAQWPVQPAPPDSASTNLFGAGRSWLTDVAVTGWRGVDEDLIAGAKQAVEALWAEPEARRLAVLLDGVIAELRASVPIATMDSLPVRRWADLWTRAVLLSNGGTRGAAASREVTGRLLILGVDVQEHPTAFSVQLHGVLESGDSAPVLARTGVSAAKTDTITGTALWRLLGDHPKLLKALAENRGVAITGMSMRESGDLLWDDSSAEPGEEVDPFTTARLRLPEVTAPPVPPLDRHPVRIAEPVLVEDYRVKRDGDRLAFDLGDGELPVDADRLPACGPLSVKLIAASTACIGLLRWDAGQWRLRPLAVRSTVKKQPLTVCGGDWALGPTDPKVAKAEARAGDTVAVLRERAGRLLRS